jgi:copper transport protein
VSLAAIIFVASSAITAAPPARGPEFAPPRPAENFPSTLTLTADDLLVALSIRPNKPGPNIVSVDVLNTRRPPPAEILRVLVRLAYRDRDLGTQTLIVEPEDADTYRLRTDALSLAGAWQAQVAVRRKGMEDSVADFDWQVESLAPSAPPRPVVVSSTPIEPTLTVLAVGLAVCTVLAALGFAGQARAGHSQPAQTSLTQP